LPSSKAGSMPRSPRAALGGMRGSRRGRATATCFSPPPGRGASGRRGAGCGRRRVGATGTGFCAAPGAERPDCQNLFAHRRSSSRRRASSPATPGCCSFAGSTSPPNCGVPFHHVADETGRAIPTRTLRAAVRPTSARTAPPPICFGHIDRCTEESHSHLDGYLAAKESAWSSFSCLSCVS